MKRWPLLVVGLVLLQAFTCVQLITARKNYSALHLYYEAAVGAYVKQFFPNISPDELNELKQVIHTSKPSLQVLNGQRVTDFGFFRDDKGHWHTT